MKKTNLQFLFALLFTLCFFQGYSQKNFHDKKTVHLAKEYLRIEEYAAAKELFQQLVDEHPENSNFKYYLGVCYFKLGEADKALKYFKESTKESANTVSDFNYFLAKTFHLAHHFEDAITYYEKYIEMIAKNTDKKYPHTADEIQAEIHKCKLGLELLKRPHEVEIINLSDKVNSPYPDYMPVLSLDETEMMFTSRRPTTTGGSKDPVDDLYYEDIYISTKTDSGWKAPKDMGNIINTKDHDATVCLSGDGKTLYIYRSADSYSEEPTGHIYFSEYKVIDWTAPQLVKGINSEYWEPSGSISPSGDMFFFSSNRPRPENPERKDRDIYMVKKTETGEWGPPVRLSNEINTTFEEDGPFIHPDGKTLYFSSNGNKSIGGFDIFKSVYDETTQTWSEPVNIGFPFNTAGDDIYIVWSADGKRAYFSSARDDSYGGKDIYMATNIQGAHSMALMIGRVFDADTKSPLTAEVVVMDNESGKVVGVFKSDSYSGKFSIALPSGKNYGISIQKQKYLYHSENITLPTMAEYSEYRKDIYLNPFKAGASSVLKNIFFDTDKAELRPESRVELDKLFDVLKKNPDLHVQISGHTDDQSTHEYNLVLSQARAVSVVQYLVDKGIEKNKIFAKGFGEVQPIDSNTTEEGRQNNRRIEFMILDTDDDAHSKYLSIKDSTMLRPGDELYGKLLEDFKAVYLKQQADKAPVVGEYVFYTVHFPFNHSDEITEFSKNILKNLLGYMQHYPTVKLKITAHPDPLGDEEFNIKLATDRAKTIYNFLIK
ncbi:MAG: OmpA family protein, partial [Cytophagaceae bacterium]|nr:OmpA family protein [Cytophagaceae bacterium]